MGPLMATLLRLTDSRTWSGSGVPYRSITSTPASWTSHSNWTPVASRTLRVASDSSGPTPSPGMNVTGYAMQVRLLDVGCSGAGHASRTLRADGETYRLVNLHRRSTGKEPDSVPTKGLEEIVAAQTAISDIDGKLGKLWYAGYSIDDLCQHSTF